MKNNLYFNRIVWFLFFFGCGLRFYNLNSTLGPGDENQYLLDYGNASIKFISTTFFAGGHHVFHTLIMRLLIMVFGDENAIAIRFPAFISNLGSLFIVYKISTHIFKSKITSIVALSILVLTPIHIYYGNIARGYSFIIFFSALMILSVIHIFESGKFGIWGWVLTFSAFLSTYTIATNVYFVFGLGCWIALVIFTPSLYRETSFTISQRNKVVISFLTVFIAAGLMTLLAYWPILNALAQEAKSYHLPKTAHSSNLRTVYELIKESLKLIFAGKLIFFSPFLILGIILGRVKKKSYRILVICLLIIPYCIPFFTGVGGYARNFLFNIPLAMPFLGEGLMAFGLWVANQLHRPNLFLKNGFVSIFFIAIIGQTFLVYFPSSIRGFDLNDFKNDMKRFVNPLDLLVIADSRDYWYAHNIYNANLKRSIFLNKIKQIKVLARDQESLRKFNLSIQH